MIYDIKKTPSTRFGLDNEFSIAPEYNDRDDWVRGVKADW